MRGFVVEFLSNDRRLRAHRLVLMTDIVPLSYSIANSAAAVALSYIRHFCFPLFVGLVTYKIIFVNIYVQSIVQKEDNFRPSCSKFSTTTPSFLYVFGRAPDGL